MVSPEEIKSKEFLVSLRGYDRDEVHTFLGRVADELSQARTRTQQLEQEIERLRDESRQAPAAAPEAAPAQAPTESAMFAEIGRETQRILEAAQEAGNQMQRRARQEADKELQAARSQAARQIAEGERRREQIERVVNALDQARAALATDLRNVSRTIDNTLRELSPTETPSTSVRQAMEVEARIAASRGSGPSESGGAESGASAVAVDEPAEEPPPAAEPEPEGTPDAAEETPAVAESSERAQEDEPAAPVLSPDEGASQESAEAETAAAEAESADTATAEPSNEADAAAEEAPQTSAPAPDAEESPVEEAVATDDGSQADEAAAVDAPAEESADGATAETDSASPADTAEVAAGNGQAGDPSDAAPGSEQGPDGGSEPAAAAAALLEEDGPAAAAPEQEAAAAPSAPPMQPSATRDLAGRDPAGLRAAALSPLHPKLVRKLKRELQEVQNIALDRVRRSGGRGEVDDFLPQGEDARILGEGAAEYLEQAWRAGVSAAGKLAERDFGDGGEAPALAGRFAEETNERVRASLGATLRMGMSAGEPPQALSDRIGAVFSELKGTSAEELSATHLIRAYEIGLLTTWQEGGVKARAWVLGREPRCPEARCRQNDQSGALPFGEAFPSGHEVPPVHVGCTCTTVPVADA